MNIETILGDCDRELADGRSPDLALLGFWRAVAHVKRHPELADAHADPMAAIDREAFRRWALLMVPLGVGTAMMILGTLFGLAITGAAYSVDAPWNGLLILAGTGILLVPTHGLGHLIVGRLLGIRFTDWFIGSWKMPQPGVKVDYGSYLRASPRARAWIHASGAIVTKLIPFLDLGAAWGAGAPAWTLWVLATLGAAMIVTDVAWSTKASDWKKFRRELRYAR